MAAYVKNAEQVVLALSRAEARALLAAALRSESAQVEPLNGATQAARSRALRALELACSTSSRSGAEINYP